jgi:predicted phage-related endonuclease
MPITAEQKLARFKVLGGSDIPVLLGYGYGGKTAYDLWLEKTSKLEPEPETEEQARGTDLEPGIVNFAERTLATPLTRNVTLVCPQLPILAVNLDALAGKIPAPVEAKSAANPEGWDESGPPERVMAQVMSQILCVANAEIGYAAVILPYLKMELKTVERNADLCDVILETASEFWEHHVKADIPPEHVAPTQDIVKRMRRQIGKTITFTSDELLLARQAAKRHLDRAELMFEGADAMLKAKLGDAEIGMFPGAGTVTYFEQRQERIDSKRLRAEQPAIAADYIKEIKFRKLLVKERKTTKEST